MHSLVWSYGGGVQTAGIAVLIHEGLLPRPDFIVMADTGRERLATWDYLRHHMGPYLAGVGLSVEIAPRHLATVDLYAHNGDLLLPVFTSSGKLPTFCSGYWKMEVVQRYLRARGVESCLMWLGISLDEKNRVVQKRKKWIDHGYPLIDLGISREGCLRLVRQAGLPEPPKSCCWMCPHQRPEQWIEQRENYPDEFRAAVVLDHELREVDDRGGVYLYSGRVPLDEADFEGDIEAEDDRYPLFRGCSSGYCWT